jgi:uncharacterized protein YegP (UPF0339 family)/uncharacterized surface protein with fasciclin (FAS1) repeats
MADILDIAVEAGGFKTFVAAVQAAGLVETLKGKGPFTLLVPDDDAFAKLPAGTVDGLLKNVPKLRAVLMYHMLPGKLTVDEIGQMKTAKTVQGQEVKIDASHWWTLHINPLINDAYMINTDIVTDNGMIHVLSRVLMPNMELTCPACGMGFMTMQAMNAHTKMGHVAEVPMPPALVMPVVEAAPEPLPPTEVIREKIPVVANVTGVFEVITDHVGRFRFHLKAANGQIIAVSQSYGAKESALKGIDSIKKNAPIAKIADFTTGGNMPESSYGTGIVQGTVFEIQFNAPDRYRFHLKAANGEIIAVSQSYLSKQSAQNGIESVKKNAPMAKIIDQTTAVT